MRLVLLTKAQNNLLDIVRYIATESGSLQTAKKFRRKLLNKCMILANQPFLMGKLRSELGDDIRSYAYGNYLIFFRYGDEVMEIITIIEGHRDIDALFD